MSRELRDMLYHVVLVRRDGVDPLFNRDFVERMLREQFFEPGGSSPTAPGLADRPAT